MIAAFQKDNNLEVVKLLSHSQFKFKDFVQHMSDKHEYVNSFKGMQMEMVKALDSIMNKKPIHWMETLDDLMYCLNFHAELLSAEDHLFFNRTVKPFLMNVIAALPLRSADILLALYSAGCIDLVEGKVSVLEQESKDDSTVIEVENKNGEKKTFSYKMFIDCSGQDTVDVENFPFPSLVKNGKVRSARAKFRDAKNSQQLEVSIDPDKVFMESDALFLSTGGIDVAASYNVIQKNGNKDERIYDLSFTHTLGCRPYSYGLQACNATSAIMATSLLYEINGGNATSIETITKFYEQNNL